MNEAPMRCSAGDKLRVFALPEDARPVKWTADGLLICSVRTEVPMALNRDTKAFTQTTPKKLESK